MNTEIIELLDRVIDILDESCEKRDPWDPVVVQKLIEIHRVVFSMNDEYKKYAISSSAGAIGSILSEKKRLASIENGKKGGRPKKIRE